MKFIKANVKTLNHNGTETGRTQEILFPIDCISAINESDKNAKGMYYITLKKGIFDESFWKNLSPKGITATITDIQIV
jgi:hypothetical protein